VTGRRGRREHYSRRGHEVAERRRELGPHMGLSLVECPRCHREVQPFGGPTETAPDAPWRLPTHKVGVVVDANGVERPPRFGEADRIVSIECAGAGAELRL
jgi:hypothetical protein